MPDSRERVEILSQVQQENADGQHCVQKFKECADNHTRKWSSDMDIREEASHLHLNRMKSVISLEQDGKYYVLRTNAYDEEATAARKACWFSERRRRHFFAIYEPFVRKTYCKTKG